MAGNIGREFNLVVLADERPVRQTFKSAKYSANGDFTNLVLYTTAAVPDPAHADIGLLDLLNQNPPILKKLAK